MRGRGHTAGMRGRMGAAGAAAAVPLATGLLAFYRLDNSLADASGNGRPLAGAATYATGLINQGLATGSPARSPFLTGMDWRSAWSASAWVKAPTGATSGLNNPLAVSGAGGTALQVQVNSDDLAPSYALLVLAADSAAASETAAAAGWRHVAATYDGARVRLYVDGAPAAGPTTATMPSGNLDLTLSADGGDFATPIDLLGVWSRALSAADVAALYASGAGLDPTL